MIADLKKHSSHYTILAVWLAMGFLLFALFKANDYMQLLVVQLIAAGYFIWGLVHHLVLGDLKGKIVLEYLLVAVLAALFMAAVIWQR